MISLKYEAVIGLEIHSELKTATKIFCGCATTFGAEQNTHVCPVCLGLPGVLPTINKRVVEFAIKAGLATNCKINKYSKFDQLFSIRMVLKRIFGTIIIQRVGHQVFIHKTNYN